MKAIQDRLCYPQKNIEPTAYDVEFFEAYAAHCRAGIRVALLELRQRQQSLARERHMLLRYRLLCDIEVQTQILQGHWLVYRDVYRTYWRIKAQYGRQLAQRIAGLFRDAA